MRGPTERGISQGGDPAGLELGAGWVKVALARRQTMGRPHLNNTAQTEVRVVKDPPPIRSVPSRVGEGRVEDRSGVGGGGRSDAAK